MKKYVDPAKGWAYGFPAIWDDEKMSFEEFLDSKGYPKKMREFPMSFWFAADNKKSDPEGSL
jgi:hypothetical protein